MPVTVTHAKSNTMADWAGVVTVGNSTGGSATAQGSDLVRPVDWNSAHQITFSLTASEAASVFNFGTGLTSSTAAGGISVGMDSGAFFEPFPLPNTNSTLSAPGIGTWYLDGPYKIPLGFGKGQLNVLVSNAAGFLHGAAFSAASTASVSRFQTFFNQLALYKQGTGASTSRLETVWTGQMSILVSQELRLTTANTSSGTISNAITLSFPAQWDSIGGLTYSTTAQSGTTAVSTSTMASTRADNLITGAVAYVTGARMDIIGFSTTIPPAEYWLGHMFTSTSSTAGTAGGIGTAGTLFSTHSRLGLLENAMGAYRVLGKSVSNSTTNVPPFHGYLASTTSNATSIINTSDVRATTGRMYWNYFVSTY
jgi:hypothetical protein